MAKNRIDCNQVYELIVAYGMEYKICNFFTIQIQPPDQKYVYNWYHTKGTLVRSGPNMDFKNLGKFTNVEDVIDIINKNESKEQSSSSIR